MANDDEEIYGDDETKDNTFTVYTRSENRAGFNKIETIRRKLNLTIRDFEEAKRFLKSKEK